MRLLHRLRLSALLPALLLALALSAQQNAHWCFGHGAAIDFSSGHAVATTSAIDALEGTAAVSDNSGNLLFFTDGLTIWDRNGTPMANGTGLLGGASSTQAALIVPMPGACNRYYVFTSQDHLQAGDIHYTVVDMCLNGGLGDVDISFKNILVALGCGERLTAVPHTNGTDVWIITHALGNADFLAFQLTSTGVQLVPVTSTVGAVHDVSCHIGPLKASHDGTRLICESTFCNICDLLDFDAATGTVSNVTDLITQLGLPGAYYGAEFSPDDRLLYLGTTFGDCMVHQVDLATLQTTLLVELGGDYMIGALQLGPDGRIYVARKDQPFLDVIEAPNVPGLACGYVSVGLALVGGSTSDIGMPNLVPSTVMGPPLGGLQVHFGPDTSYCNASPFPLSAPAGGCGPSYLWQDGSSAANYTVSGPGTYWLRVTDACGVATDTLVVYPPGVIPIDLGPDTTLCPGNSIVLDAAPGVNPVLWQDGSTNATLTASQAGVYWAQVSDACGSSRDSVVVQLAPTLALSLGPDVTLCAGDSVVLSAPSGTLQAFWSDGSQALTRGLTAGGTYWLTVQGACNSASDTITIAARTSGLDPLQVPNVFTPNGDGMNDLFRLPGTWASLRMSIYNRYGQVVFTTDFAAEGWDGHTGDVGEPVPAGTYFYVIEQQDPCDGSTATEHGTVTLLR